MTPSSALADFVIPYRADYVTIASAMLTKVDVAVGETILRGIVDMDGSRVTGSLDPTGAPHTITRSYYDYWTHRLLGDRGRLLGRDLTHDVNIPTYTPTYAGETPLVIVDPVVDAGVRLGPYPPRITVTAAISGPWAAPRTVLMRFYKMGSLVILSVAQESAAPAVVPNRFISAPAGTVPSDRRPSVMMRSNVMVSNSSANVPGFFEIYPDGSINIKTYLAGGFFTAVGNATVLINTPYYSVV